MGPEQRPSRSRFQWDIRNAPWTDGKGPQEQYYNAVRNWKTFHDKLPDGNSNKIPATLQGLVLQSQLYDRALDLVKKVTAEEIQSDDGALKVASAIYRKDVLSLVTDAFQRFLDLLRTKQGETETYKNFESRFDAHVCRLDESCQGAELPSALVSFLLLANSRIDSTQRISILSSATPVSTSTVNRTMKDVLSLIKYDEIASVIRACDEPKRSLPLQARSAETSVGRYTRGNRFNSNVSGRNKQRLTPEQLSDLKSKSTCNRCKKKGHWASDLDVCPDAPNKVKGNSNTVSKQEDNDSKGQSSSSSATKNRTTVSFFMGSLTTDNSCTTPGPLVDNAAPYSGIGLVELRAMKDFLLPNWDGKLDPVPRTAAHRPYWQYGSGSHKSPMRKILGSVMLRAMTDNGNPVQICHLVIDKSSQWVVGRNVTRHSDIVHMNGHYLQFRSTVTGTVDTISMVEDGDHEYFPASIFCQNSNGVPDDSLISLSCSAHSSNLPWKSVKRIIEKVHKHVCGHGTYEDIKLLLERNQLWSDECSQHLVHLLESCRACSAVSHPAGTRKVSLSSMSRDFNDVVCVDHFFPDGLDVFHMMDSKTRYSTGTLVDSLSMREAVSVFESKWLSEFWPPETVIGDQAFNNEEFKTYLKLYDIRLRDTPPRRHNKNALESKHRVLRDIYLRLKEDNPEEDTRLRVAKMFRISNDLYGNNIASAHELAKGYTRPVSHDYPKFLPQDVRTAQEELSAKRKLNLILCSKSTSDVPIKIGDLVQVYTKHQNHKRGVWSNTVPVIAFDPSSGIFTVPGSRNRRRKVAIEDVHHAVTENELAIQIQTAIDQISEDIDLNIEDIDLNIEEVDNDSQAFSDVESAVDNNVELILIDDDVGDDANFTPSAEITLEDLTYVPEQPSTYGVTPPQSPQPHGQDDLPSEEVTSSVATLSQRPANSSASIKPDITAGSCSVLKMNRSLKSNDIELLPGSELSSVEQDALRLYHDRFKSKQFMLHHAQGLPSYIAINAYETEENFLDNCQRVSKHSVPSSANLIRSYALYKIKTRDDGSFTCKARIAPHGNEDVDKHNLKTDSACCPPLGIRVLVSLCVIHQWYLTKIDVKGAFLQSGKAERDVYVIPPRESRDKNFVWLLNVAAYGLVNANAKWQFDSDQTLINLGLNTTVHISQFFYCRTDTGLVLVVVKVTDDMFVGGSHEAKHRFIRGLANVYDLGTITHLPGSCWFYGLHVTQDQDYVININADHKLENISPHVLSWSRRKESCEKLNSLEISRFNSINGSIGFVGVHACPFASFVCSYLQKRRNSATVHDISMQRTLLKRMVQIGSVSTYKRPAVGEYPISVIMFSDASRPNENGQLAYIAGILFGELKQGSIWHILSWSSALSRRPVKSIGSAEVLAAGAAVDEGILICSALSAILKTEVPLCLIVDSKDLCDTLSSCHAPEDRSIRGDAQLIRYYFETKRLQQVRWVSGKQNFADVLTKKDSPLLDVLQLAMFEGLIPINFDNSIARNASQDLG